jgi:hypothetical protein
VGARPGRPDRAEPSAYFFSTLDYMEAAYSDFGHGRPRMTNYRQDRKPVVFSEYLFLDLPGKQPNGSSQPYSRPGFAHKLM